MRGVCTRWAAFVTAAVCCIVLTACHKEMPGRLDGQYPSDAASTSTASGSAPAPSAVNSDTSDASEGESVSAPVFAAGRYVMESTTGYEQVIYQGSSIASRLRTSQTYTYDIRLTEQKGGALTAVYTFRRIQTSYEGSETAVMDTDDPSGQSDETAIYYDVIGQSFTAKVSSDGSVTVTGIDKIHKNVPDATDFITQDNMEDIAKDVFYNLPSPLAVGSAWQLRQSGIVNTYSVTKINDKNLLIGIKGGALDVPAPFERDGITYAYQTCEPLSGSLVINRANRMLQEQSSYQRNAGEIEYNGTVYAFEETSSSLCEITKAK